jgi:hypothetical protein
MSLNEELKALRTRSEARRPPEVVATMHRAVDELRASGAPARVLKVGALAPRFALPNAEEQLVDSATLRARPAGGHVLSRPVVTLLQRRAGSSTEGRTGDRGARRHAGGHLTPVARAQP